VFANTSKSSAMTGAIPAIIMFIDSHSGMNEDRSAGRYRPPIMFFMNRAWKMNSPKANPATYSTIRSSHMGRPSKAVMTAAAMMPVASPAMQCTVEPTPCFHSGLTNSSCVPGAGSLSVSTYSSSPIGPM
jgi:hypothetical protein